MKPVHLRRRWSPFTFAATLGSIVLLTATDARAGAQALADGYIRFGAGPAWIQPIDFHMDYFSGSSWWDPPFQGSASLESQSQMEFDTGFLTTFVMGAQIPGSPLAIEMEMGLGLNDCTFAAGNTHFSGSMSQFPILVNAVWQADLGRGFSTWAGAGVGAVFSDLEVDDEVIDVPWGIGYVQGYGIAAVFAYQFMAGLNYRLTDNATLGVNYHFMGTTAPHWEPWEDYYYYYWGEPESWEMDGDPLLTQTVMLELRFSW